jgi:nucleoid-associated protein YgaU
VEVGRRARWAPALLVACEAVAVAGLHRLGSVDGFAIPRHDLTVWLRDTPSEDVLLAAIRLATLVAAWWLLATTLAYLAARLAHAHRAARAVGWATCPAVRRWVDRAAAVSIMTASTLGAARPAAADPPPATNPVQPVVVDLDHRDRSSDARLPPVSVRTGHAVDAPRAPTPPPPSDTPLPTPAPSRTHRISPGEHLWSIAASHAADVGPYWRRLVALNRPHLRSGDPNLVYPGETIELPPR